MKNPRLRFSRKSRLRNSGGQNTTYTIKRGDNLLKILMRDYGLTHDEARASIEKIQRENNISDSNHIKIGQKIVIPLERNKEDLMLKHHRPMKNIIGPSLGKNSTAGGQAFRIEARIAAITDQQAVSEMGRIWKQIVPSETVAQKPLSLQSTAFSLSLDPKRYPVFATMDGGRILLDQDATIPPLVKSLIESKDPTVHIVSESPANAKRLLAAMLGSAGFYSVEENFNLEFGADPKLTVRSDFKVEKTPESLIKQDIILLNSSKKALPPPLDELLKKEGFTVYEPFASKKTDPAPNPSRQICEIVSKSQPDMVKAVLNALKIPYHNDRSLDVFATDNNGITLSVKAERYFEREGQRFVITSFDNDPITYTLFRILETKGYKVIMLENHDDFRKVLEKILSPLHIQGGYAQHNLWPDNVSNYSLQMSGFKLEGAGVPGGSMFITNLTLDKLIHDLLKENGYSVNVNVK